MLLRCDRVSCDQQFVICCCCHLFQPLLMFNNWPAAASSVQHLMRLAVAPTGVASTAGDDASVTAKQAVIVAVVVGICEWPLPMQQHHLSDADAMHIWRTISPKEQY